MQPHLEINGGGEAASASAQPAVLMRALGMLQVVGITQEFRNVQ